MPDLADILELVDATGDLLAARAPADGPAVIRWGSQLVVREGQSALFLRDGRAMQLFEPGRHVLTTQNVAGLTGFVAGLAYGGETPFRAEVVFVGRQLFRDLRWGTPEPVYIPDPVLLQVPVRANGRFAIRVADPALFVPKVVGTRPDFRQRDLEEFLRAQYVVSALTDALASLGKPFVELPRFTRELGTGVRAILAPEFAALGLELTDLSVNSVTTTEEIQATLNGNAKIASEAFAKAKGTQYDLQARAAGAEALKRAGTSYREVGATDALKEVASNVGEGGGGSSLDAGVSLGAAMLVPQMMQGMLRPEAAPGGPAAHAAEEVDPVARLKQLKELLDLGAITQEEYDAKKAEWLKRL
ncbi:MAG TPA: SPFH domain-containing protein [Thermoanaerobaculia bacterium]|nr:SPFH domain-containing protein [Thermoanaerobaculia bacterium]HQP86498.1 SPFH domain-containing protein [Thermoanaerobaculia bacterium]